MNSVKKELWPELWPAGLEVFWAGTQMQGNDDVEGTCGPDPGRG